MANAWITEIHERRNRTLTEGQALLERVNPETGALAAEDKAQFDRLMERAETLNETLEDAKKLERMAAEGDRTAEVITDVSGMVNTGEAPADVAAPNHGHELKLLSDSRGRSGTVKLRFDNYMNWRRELQRGMGSRDYVERAIAVGTGSGAGNAGSSTVPSLVEARFFDVLLNINGIRKAGAEVWTTEAGGSMKLPKVTDFNTAPPTSAVITAEAANIGDSTPTFSSVDTNPVKVAGLVEVSREIMEDASPNIEGMIGDRLGRDIGWKSEALYNLGSGTVEGVFANTQIPAAQRITTAATGSITYSEIVQTKYLVNDYPQTGPMGPCWVMQKGTLGAIFRITGAATGNDHPIFVMAASPDVPDTILGDRVVYNNFAGALATAGSNVIAYGDFYGAYIIRDVGTVEIDYDESVNFKSDETVFRAILRTDGKFVNKQLLSWLRNKA